MNALRALRLHDDEEAKSATTAQEGAERRRAAREQARLIRILEATPDFIAISTPEGALTYLNRAGRELAGLGPDAALDGRTLAQMHPAWAWEIVQEEAIPTAVRAGVWSGESAVSRADGSEVPVLQLALAHYGTQGEVECISIVMRDISARKIAEVARIEWANRYDAAIRASGQLLFDWDSVTGDITYGANTAQLLGFSAPELAGGLSRLRALVQAEDLAAFDAEAERVIATRDPLFLEFRVRRKDARVVLLQAKGYFFLDRQGRLSRMIGFLADVTEQRHAEQELARAHEGLEARVERRTAELARAYDEIQDRARQQEAVARLGQHALAGAEVDALLSEAATLVRGMLKVDFCSILQLAEGGEMLEMRAHCGWPDEMRLAPIPAGSGSLSGFTLQSNEPVVSDDLLAETRFPIVGSLRQLGVTCAVSVKIAAGEQPLGALCAFRVAARPFTQEDVHFLQSVANVLTAAITRQRAEESIRQVSAQAEAANRAKSEFLSRMSHELRTPLNAILGFTQLLELEDRTPSQAESIEHVSRAGRHLLALINEVLDIARIESGRLALSPEPIPVSEFVGAAIDLIRPLAQRHGITMSLNATAAEGELHVFADAQRLKQVMLNLLANAVKYNRPNGIVAVQCARAATPGRLRISVADTGRGIAPEKIGRLFTPFERLGAEATEVEGTGIGLTLSRGIMHALGGEIGVHSIEGQGSVFWIELPEADAPPAAAAPQENRAQLAANPAASTHTLLYVEDQDLNLRLVERILAHHPQYRLLTSMQGRLAIDLAREHHPDLILLDLNLPDMLGDEVLAHLKADPAIRDIPVLMVSADAMGDRIEQLLDAGAVGYLTKPYKVSEFLRIIQETLEKDAAAKLVAD